MPITIATPLADEPFGAGFTLQVTTSVFGPFELGTRFVAELVHPPTERSLGFSQMASQTGSATWAWRSPPDGPEGNPALYASSVGQPATLRVQMLSPTSVVLDEGTVSVTYDPQSGSAFTVEQLLRTLVPVGSGFTAADRDELEVIHAAVNPVFAPTVAGGVAAAIRLGDLLSKPPPEFLMRSDPILISGTGFLTRPLPGVPVAAYGFHWTWHTIPPGFGLELGVPDEYQRRVVQFGVIVANRDGSEHYATIADANSENQQITWRAPWPQRVMYSVAPGAVVSFRWLLLSPLVA